MREVFQGVQTVPDHGVIRHGLCGQRLQRQVYIGQIVQRFAAYMIGPGLPFPELFLVLFVRTVVPSDDYGKYAGKEDKGCKNK